MAEAASETGLWRALKAALVPGLDAREPVQNSVAISGITATPSKIGLFYQLGC